MKIEVNMNQMVKAELTEKGKEILSEYHRKHIPSNANDDIIECELWHLFNIFGEHLYNGCDIPFVDNKIKL